MAANRKIQLIIGAKDKASKVLKSFAVGLKRWGVGALKITGAVGAGFAGITAAVGLLLNRYADQIDQQAKVAEKLGLTNEKLSVYRDAAEDAGISSNTFDMALQRMTRRVSEAAAGTGEAVAALQELGLDAEALNKKTPDKALQEIIGALEGVENQADKVRLAFKLFDSEGVGLVGLSTEGLQQAQDDADALGLKLSEAQAKGVEAANDAGSKIGRVWGDFLKYITAQIAPGVERVMKNAFAFLQRRDLRKWADDLSASIIGVAKMMAKALPAALLLVLDIVAKVAMGFRGWVLLWQELKIQAFGFAGIVQKILRFMGEGFRQIFSALNFDGMFDGAVSGLQEFVNSQDQIIKQLEKDRSTTITQQINSVADYQKEQQAIEGYKSKIAGVEEAIRELTKEQKESATVTVEAEEKKAEAYHSTTAKINRQIDAVRRLKDEQGRSSSGSFQNVASFGDADQAVEYLDSRLEAEADK